jgi:hypothetical protein
MAGTKHSRDLDGGQHYQHKSNHTITYIQPQETKTNISTTPHHINRHQHHTPRPKQHHHEPSPIQTTQHTTSRKAITHYMNDQSLREENKTNRRPTNTNKRNKRLHISTHFTFTYIYQDVNTAVTHQQALLVSLSFSTCLVYDLRLTELRAGASRRV